jgi:Nucleotidyltransferase domain
VNRERATSLAENLLRNLDIGQSNWPLSLITEVYVFGSFARGAQEPGDLDIDVELAGDEEWNMHVVSSLPYGRNPYAVLRKPLSAGRRGYQYTFDFRDRADFDMTLLWRKGDTLGTALGRLHAIQPDPLAGRAPRDSMLPEFEGIEDWVPRPYRTALCAAVSDGALRIERLSLPDGVVASPEAEEHIRLRWNPASPLRRAGTAVVSHWEQHGIDPGRGHLHGRDIRDQDTPYFANFGWSHFTSIPHCLTEYSGIEWLEVVHPTKAGPLDCLRLVPLDTAKIELLHW